MKPFARFCFVLRIGLEYIHSLQYIRLCLDIQENIFLKKEKRTDASKEEEEKETDLSNLRLDRVIFSAKRSFLFKKRIIDVLTNHLLLQIESNKRRDSCIRFVVSSSTKTWSYSLKATINMIAVTSSKQWIHFFRSDRWPPTSKTRKFKSKREKELNLIFFISLFVSLDQ